MWLVVAARTVQRSLTGKMFFAPCLGTDLFQKKLDGAASKDSKNVVWVTNGEGYQSPHFELEELHYKIGSMSLSYTRSCWDISCVVEFECAKVALMHFKSIGGPPCLYTNC